MRTVTTLTDDDRTDIARAAGALQWAAQLDDVEYHGSGLHGPGPVALLYGAHVAALERVLADDLTARYGAMREAEAVAL